MSAQEPAEVFASTLERLGSKDLPGAELWHATLAMQTAEREVKRLLELSQAIKVAQRLALGRSLIEPLSDLQRAAILKGWWGEVQGTSLARESHSPAREGLREQWWWSATEEGRIARDYLEVKEKGHHALGYLHIGRTADDQIDFVLHWCRDGSVTSAEEDTGNHRARVFGESGRDREIADTHEAENSTDRRKHDL